MGAIEVPADKYCGAVVERLNGFRVPGSDVVLSVFDLVVADRLVVGAAGVQHPRLEPGPALPPVADPPLRFRSDERVVVGVVTT